MPVISCANKELFMDTKNLEAASSLKRDIWKDRLCQTVEIVFYTTCSLPPPFFAWIYRQPSLYEYLLTLKSLINSFRGYVV
jgi:hypothetical protein